MAEGECIGIEGATSFNVILEKFRKWEDYPKLVEEEEEQMVQEPHADRQQSEKTASEHKFTYSYSRVMETNTKTKER